MQIEKIFTFSEYDEYYQEFHNSMRASELTLISYTGRSPQLEFRNTLVETARTICTELLLSRTTLHLSIYIIDRFMDQFEIAQQRLLMFSAVCVLIAVKLEDKSECVPNWTDIQPFLDYPIAALEYSIFELMILNSLQWRVNVPTAALFLDYYIGSAITLSDKKISPGEVDVNIRLQEYSVIQLQVYNLIFYLLDMSLNDVRLIGVLPSKLAASCILCARMILDYQPYWTRKLKNLTNYEIQDVFKLAEDLKMQFMSTESKKPIYLVNGGGDF